MAVWSLFNGRSATLRDPGFWSGFFGLDNASGKTVSTDTALRLATVFACVRLTAQAIATMPLGLYERGDNGDRKSAKHPDLIELLQESPNDSQTPAEFWEGMAAHMVLNGNAYAEKTLSADGKRIISLVQLDSENVTPVRLDNGSLVYRLSRDGKKEDIAASRIFHLKGYGFGGDAGVSVVQHGAQTFGAAMATDESAAKIFANGLQPSGVLSSDQVLKPEQRSALAGLMSKFAGSNNAGKLLILESGLKYQAMSMNPEDAQMLDTRRFAIEEICRWFGIPPIIVGHAAQGQTMWGSGVEQILIAWLTLGLNPLLRKIEQRIRKSIIRPMDGAGSNIYAEFNREGLLQADSASKATFLGTMVDKGLMTRNEGRAKLNLPKMAGGDELTVQMQMQPIGSVGVVAPAPATPASAPKPDGA